LVIAYIAIRSFKQYGSPGILLIGAGMLAYGVGSIAAPIAAILPEGFNLNVTIHNSGALVGAILQISGAILLFSGPRSAHDGDLNGKIVLVYGIVSLLLAGIIIGALQGIIPAFFVPGTGYTTLREIVLMGAIEFFVIAAVLFYLSYTKKREEFLFWYSIGIALIAVGLFSATLVSIPGNPLSWVARSTQYLGTCFVLIAFLAVRNEALRRHIPLEEVLSRFFGEAETSYKTLVETATDAIIVFDSDDRVIVWNGAAEKMFGYSHSEAIGSSFIKLAIPDEFADLIKCGSASTAIPETDSTVHNPIEIAARRKDRSTFPIELAISRHMVAGTRVCTCIIRDLTDRKKAEEAICESEEKYSLIYNKAPFAIALARIPSGAVVTVNKAWEELFGYTENEAVGKTTIELGINPNSQGRTSLIAELQRKGTVNNWEFDFQTKSGAQRVVSFSTSAVTLGREKYWLSTMQDITERKRVEEALQKSEQLYRAIGESIDFGVWVCEPDGRNIYASESFLNLVGLTQEQCSNFGWGDVLHPDDAERTISAWKECVRTGGKWDIEHRFRGVDGQWHPVLARGIPLHDEMGNSTGWVGINLDISDLKRAEDELIQKNENLNALNEELTATEENLIEELARREQALNKALVEKEVLLSEIHHRVKNNLTAFISLLSLEGSTEDTPAGKTLKQDLQNRARSMALIHETLYRTHMYDEVDMGMYLTTLVDQIANSFAATRPVKTIVDAQGVMLDIPRATPAGLIINELVTNSFKYAFPESFDSPTVRNDPPTITVTLTKNEGAYKMTVRDNGIGIPPGFDIAKTKTLGLKLVNFLAKHQLQAKVEVRGDNGTEFIFRLTELEDGA
jgi:PAS domain S-box-containing protein